MVDPSHACSHIIMIEPTGLFVRSSLDHGSLPHALKFLMVAQAKSLQAWFG